MDSLFISREDVKKTAMVNCISGCLIWYIDEMNELRVLEERMFKNRFMVRSSCSYQ